jgi:hypothetical protein
MTTQQIGLAHVFRFADYVKIEVFIPRQQLADMDLARFHDQIVNIQLESAPDSNLTRTDIFGQVTTA